jgi:hypothetical protein
MRAAVAAMTFNSIGLPARSGWHRVPSASGALLDDPIAVGGMGSLARNGIESDAVPRRWFRWEIYSSQLRVELAMSHTHCASSRRAPAAGLREGLVARGPVVSGGFRRRGGGTPPAGSSSLTSGGPGIGRGSSDRR